MVNKVILIGNLAHDPEVKATAKGVYIANLVLATSTYTGKNEEGTSKEKTEFHRLVVFGKRAEFAGEYRDALDAARDMQHWAELRAMLHRWHLRAVAYADPEFWAAAREARDAQPGDLHPVPADDEPGFAGILAVDRRKARAVAMQLAHHKVEPPVGREEDLPHAGPHQRRP